VITIDVIKYKNPIYQWNMSIVWPVRLRGVTLKVTAFSNMILSDAAHVFAGGNPVR
jgi:hypothetical protein